MNGTHDPIPELIEAVFDELAEMHDQIVAARNAVSEMNGHYLAAREHLLMLRATTNSVELTDPNGGDGM